jgi:hypothetical protein
MTATSRRCVLLGAGAAVGLSATRTGSSATGVAGLESLTTGIGGLLAHDGERSRGVAGSLEQPI